MKSESFKREKGCTCDPDLIGSYAGCPVHSLHKETDEHLIVMLKEKIFKPTSLTPNQKLNAISYKYYLGGVKWTPKPGDYYTTVRNDMELYQVVNVDEKNVYTVYTTDPEKRQSVWPIEKFTTEDFGINRVWVPDFILKN